MFTDQFPAPVRAILKRRREGRFNRLISAVSTWDGMKVLDVGCGIDGRSFEDFADPSWQITGTDILPVDEVRHSHPKFNYRICDVRDMHDVANKEFDLLVSIGMLEHICPPPDYAAACREMQRVAKQYAIVVPYKWAWIEPHYGVPFFGGMPKTAQRGLIRLFNINGHRNRMDYFEDNFRWRSNAEYKRDFPGSKVIFMPTFDNIAVVKSLTITATLDHRAVETGRRETTAGRSGDDLLAVAIEGNVSVDASRARRPTIPPRAV